MGQVSYPVPVPAEGPGPAVLIADLGELRTLFAAGGTASDLVYLELSPDGAQWSRDPSLGCGGTSPPLSARFAARFARAYRAAGSSTNLTLQVTGAETSPDVARVVPVPSTIGPGPAVLIADLGELRTLFASGGTASDLVYLELSPDGAQWSRDPTLSLAGTSPPISTRTGARYCRAYRAAGSGALSLQICAKIPSGELSPQGGGLDDGPVLQAALEASAYGAEVLLGPGTYTVATPIQVPSGATLRAGPGVRIVSTLTPTPGDLSPGTAVFVALPPLPGAGKTTALAADTVPGSATITLTNASAFALGDELALVGVNYVAGYSIRSITGNTVTVDRVVVHSFPAGSTVVERVVPKDIRCYFDGAVITGTGDAAIEWSGALRCTVRGLRVTTEAGAFTDQVANFDVGARDCELLDSDLDAGGATLGFAFESAERCRAERVWVRRAGTVGWFLSAGYGCELDQVHSESSAGVGGQVSGTLAGAASGGKAVSLVGCTFVACALGGLEVANSSTRVEVVNCEARFNAGAGFVVNAGTSPSTDVHFTNCNSSQNLQGFVVVAGCSGVTFSGCTADRSSSYGLVVDGACSVTGFASRDCGSGGVQIGSAGRVDARQLELGSSTTGFWAAFVSTSSQNRALTASGVRVSTVGGSGTKVVFSSAGAGTLEVEQLQLIGAATYGWIDVGGGTLLRGTCVSLSAAATPYSGGTVRDADPLSSAPTGVKTATYTAAVGETVMCNPTAGGFTVTLPVASSNYGRQVEVKNDSDSTNAVTIVVAGGGLIDGTTSTLLNLGRQSKTFRSTGTKWVIV